MLLNNVNELEVKKLHKPPRSLRLLEKPNNTLILVTMLKDFRFIQY